MNTEYLEKFQDIFMFVFIHILGSLSTLDVPFRVTASCWKLEYKISPKLLNIWLKQFYNFYFKLFNCTLLAKRLKLILSSLKI